MKHVFNFKTKKWIYTNWTMSLLNVQCIFVLEGKTQPVDLNAVASIVPLATGWGICCVHRQFWLQEDFCKAKSSKLKLNST